MQVAEFLSDLTSLQVCEPGAAAALVSARPGRAEGTKSSADDASSDENDVDLKRAKDLLQLHADVQSAQQTGDGIDKDLVAAREEVAKALRSL